jgi:hypothetical protein
MAVDCVQLFDTVRDDRGIRPEVAGDTHGNGVHDHAGLTLALDIDSLIRFLLGRATHLV